MRNCYVEPGIPCTSQHDTTVKNRLNYILDSLTIDKKQVILDIGTGFGTYIDHLSNHAKLYVGIDIDGENLQKARGKKENVELITMSAENLAIKDNTFDAVLMIEVLEHVLDDKKAISDIYRILKPGGGKLIITAPNKLFLFETHGFRIGSKGYGTKGLGFPVLPYLPEILRKYMANARVYTPWHLKRMLVEEGFLINNVRFLSPNLDILKITFPKLKGFIEQIRRLLDWIKKIPFFNEFLSSTIIICAEEMEE